MVNSIIHSFSLWFFLQFYRWQSPYPKFEVREHQRVVCVDWKNISKILKDSPWKCKCNCGNLSSILIRDAYGGVELALWFGLFTLANWAKGDDGLCTAMDNLLQKWWFWEVPICKETTHFGQETPHLWQRGDMAVGSDLAGQSWPLLSDQSFINR